MSLGYKSKKRFALLGLGILAGCLALALDPTSLAARMEMAIRAPVCWVARDQSQDYQVVVVAIDEDSFEALKKEPALAKWKNLRYPWPPSMHAEFLQKLIDRGVSKVAFDLLFSEPFGDMYKPEYADLSPWIKVRTDADIPVILAAKTEKATSVQPLPELLASGFSSGLVNVSLNFGTVERYFFQQGGLPSIALAVALSEGGERDLEGLGWTKERLAKNHLIRFRNVSEKAFPFISYSDVLLDRIPQRVATRWGTESLSELLNGKMVLVGGTFLDAHDIFNTPLGEMFGVEIHANALQMLSNDYKYTFSEVQPPFIWGIPFLGALLGVIVMFRYSIAWRTGFGLVFPLAFFIFSGISGAKFGIFYPVVSPLFAYFFVVGAATFFEAYIERSQRSFLQGVFGKYVSPIVANRLMDNPDLIRLGGTEEEISILFSDIEGFTTFSEQLAPEDLIKLINAYLHHMSMEILRREGTLDKFIGDAIMAFWGAPVRVDNHAELACFAALAMKDKLKEFNEKHHPFPNFPLNARIGINTGKAVVGNAGCELRFSYTAIGDSVNLASRLEGLGKAYGVNLIIGESTLAKIPEMFDVRLLDRVAVKGKKESTDIYELLGKKGSGDPEFLKLHSEAMSAYFASDWKKATELFSRKKEKFQDFHSNLFLDRIEQLRKRPDAQKFNGVWVLTSK